MFQIVNTDKISFKSRKEFYNQFSIGITTSCGREHVAYNLYTVLKKLYPEIPISIVFNKLAESSHIILPVEWQKEKVIITEELQGLTWCRNQHALAFPDKPYVIWFDDDTFILNGHVIDSIIYLHQYYDADVVRLMNTACTSMFKGALVAIKWWDERYYFSCEDVDFIERCNRNNINIIEYFPFSLVGHLHFSGENNFSKESLEGYPSKYQGHLFHLKKWGETKTIQNPEITSEDKQLIEDIDWYPEYSKIFSNFIKLPYLKY